MEKSKPLESVPFEKGFHFTTKEKGYIGITATSLSDFNLKLKTVDAASIDFHYPRGDFQRWMEDTLGDKELADKMCFVQRDVSGEKLRKELVKIVEKRIKELSNQRIGS